MTKKLKTLAEKNGYKMEIFQMQRFNSVQKDLQKFSKEPYLHAQQKGRIEANLTSLEKMPKKYSSAMIVAVPRREGFSIESAKTFFTKAVKDEGFAIKLHQSLPLKRLAVQSGMGKYGRNNIVYVNGLGSWLQIAVFFTTIPCEEDNWREKPVMADMCKKCNICVNTCPSKAIQEDRFLLYRERCKNCPECQLCCPMNDSENGGPPKPEKPKAGVYQLGKFNIELPDKNGKGWASKGLDKSMIEWNALYFVNAKNLEIEMPLPKGKMNIAWQGNASWNWNIIEISDDNGKLINGVKYKNGKLEIELSRVLVNYDRFSKCYDVVKFYLQYWSPDLTVVKGAALVIKS